MLEDEGFSEAGGVNPVREIGDPDGVIPVGVGEEMVPLPQRSRGPSVHREGQAFGHLDRHLHAFTDFDSGSEIFLWGRL